MICVGMFMAAMYTACPSLTTHEAAAQEQLVAADVVGHSKAYRIVKRGKLWCWSCGNPYKVKRLKYRIVKEDGNAYLLCKNCRNDKHVQKYLK